MKTFRTTAIKTAPSTSKKFVYLLTTVMVGTLCWWTTIQAAPVTSCSMDTWSPTNLANVPEARQNHTMIWTGSEIIVWGGAAGYNFFNTGARYNPATDTWTPISTINAPEAREEHTAVWTGREMIIWGGHNLTTSFNTGARYNPQTDTWTPISTIDVPTNRYEHTAVWTGSEMIIWGGITGEGHNKSYLNTGARYNPATNTWSTINISGAPSARDDHTAVWTGSEMIVWGGNGNGYILSTGGRYNPTTNTWTSTPDLNSPGSRYKHTAVWAGTQMIVWGGFGYDDQGGASYLSSGALYNPANNTWTPTTRTNGPGLRGYHTAIWTGSEMIVWGGAPNDTNTGGRYNPVSNSWRPTEVSTAPAGRIEHRAVWTGNEMVIWGGNSFSTPNYQNTGGRYCAAIAAPTASDGVITGRITDSQGRGVEGAVVRLGGTQHRKFITDANGYYTFANVETSGFYTVTPSRVNYTIEPAVQSFSQLGQTTNAVFSASLTSGFVNPLDTPEYFVRQHYLDFLGREPDEAGFNFWSDQILGCGNDQACIDLKRENVSAAYFLSIEFQASGGLVDGLYRAAYGAAPSYASFMPDAHEVAAGVIVGTADWQTKLAANKDVFVNEFVDRAAFHQVYDGLSSSDFVDALISHAGVSFTSAERDAWVSGLGTNQMTRADVIRSIAENHTFVTKKFNEVFVMMEYFGYLRRDPDSSGFTFWLTKLNEHNGNFEQAEMVKSFIVSGEYRDRFPR